jgi:hypothetical protein
LFFIWDVVEAHAGRSAVSGPRVQLLCSESHSHNKGFSTELVSAMSQKIRALVPRLAGRPKIRRENYMKQNIKIMKVNNWTKCIQDRGK